jgi:two-component system sensor histidine kinase PilS (NtrC family)
MEVSVKGLSNSWQSRRSLSFYLLVRVAVVTLFLGGTIAFHLRSGGDGVIFHPTLLYTLISLTYIQAFLSAFLLPKVSGLHTFSQVQTVWDLLFVSALIYFTGGIDSIFSFLFILVIISSSIFLSRREVLFVASAAAILYGSLLDLQFYEYIPRIHSSFYSELVDGRRFFYTVFINVIAFFLTAFLSGTVSERLRKSEWDLKKRDIDYEELDHLNRTILSSITSGLMILNSAGRIHSFNAAASKITGYSLEEVYDRNINVIFPSFDIFLDGNFNIVSRAEGEFRHRDGKQIILGYATSAMEDTKGKGLELLVTFQDLTQFKGMEENLKRADRLAAVGGLASGMAHEIRNPLASISGSIQLLLESNRICDEDRRLMGIVVKEANRLSSLLTDFLVFARPKLPSPDAVNLSSILDELIGMLSSDHRFSCIEIRREYPQRFILKVDRQQFRQALWNLVINGAEAMPSGGVLFLGVEESNIYVEDTGPGIPESIRDRIFDPFFTTKDCGTGLGLSTVYAIIDAHGGRIEVGTGREGGARFTIRLPEIINFLHK